MIFSSSSRPIRQPTPSAGYSMDDRWKTVDRKKQVCWSNTSSPNTRATTAALPSIRWARAAVNRSHWASNVSEKSLWQTFKTMAVFLGFWKSQKSWAFSNHENHSRPDIDYRKKTADQWRRWLSNVLFRASIFSEKPRHAFANLGQAPNAERCTRLSFGQNSKALFQILVESNFCFRSLYKPDVNFDNQSDRLVFPLALTDALPVSIGNLD